MPLRRCILLLLLFVPCAPLVLRADAVFHAKKSIIVAGHPEAMRLGDAVLDAGGNAVDALVTVSLALGVTEPGNSGLGGKLVLLYYDAATRQVHSMIALEAAPLQLDVDEVCKLTAAQRTRGWRGVATPGLPAGLYEAHARWGSKPWEQLVAPAVALAEEGFELSHRAAEMLGEFPVDVDPEAARIYAPGGNKCVPGQRLKNPDLARTLALISEHGSAGFYEGPVAEAIVTAAGAAGSPLSLDDFKNYRPRFLDPLRGEYRGLTIYTGPPPLTGGATVLSTLACIERLGFPADAAPRNGSYIDLVGRCLQQTYPEISAVAADVPGATDGVNAVLAPDYIAKLAEAAKSADVRAPRSMLDVRFPLVGFRSGMAASPSIGNRQSPIGDGLTLDDTAEASTTHLVIIDRSGNIVCATQSLGNHFGSAVVAPGTGVLLNNSMNNLGYAAKASPNFVAPGKMPRSTMCPTIVLKQDKPWLVVGAPGGQRIPTTVLQILLDTIDFARPLEESITARRFHLRRPTSRSEPGNHIDLENGFSTAVAEDLESRGWKAEVRKPGEFYFGAVNAAVFNADGTITGVADQRRTGSAGGD